MANFALVTQWGAPHVGREQMGLNVFMGGIEYYNRLQSEKKIDSFQIFIHDSGDVTKSAGMLIVQGSEDQINALQKREDYKTLVIKAAHVVPNLNIQVSGTNEGVMQRVEHLQAVRKELGIK